MVGYVFGLAILAYILRNIEIHGLDEFIQHTRESMRSDWRFASGSKWDGYCDGWMDRWMDWLVVTAGRFEGGYAKARVSMPWVKLESGN
jgi:hypothetical protein